LREVLGRQKPGRDHRLARAGPLARHPWTRNRSAQVGVWQGCPERETSGCGRRPRATRCGRLASQALAFGQRGAPTAV